MYQSGCCLVLGQGQHLYNNVVVSDNHMSDKHSRPRRWKPLYVEMERRVSSPEVFIIISHCTKLTLTNMQEEVDHNGQLVVTF